MRNLSISGTQVLELSSANLTAGAFDLDKNCAYVLSESYQNDLNVDIEIFRVCSDTTQECPSRTASLSIPAATARSHVQTIAIHIIDESQSLVIISLAGDIIVGTITDGDSPIQLDIIGSIESGVRAASWSPDDSLLALITGDGKLLLMTNAFDILSETYLQSSDKGEDQPVNVGWGSKQTQFHGSLGKVAASAPREPANAIGSSPDDDSYPRVSWRGDGAFFSVSSLEHSESRQHRTIRVYDRNGVLQTFSEPVAGLEHTLNWRPSGNLIASTQRFGYEGGGLGKEHRHDVIFFERNGLRHGEFSLRELAKISTDSGKERRWGYKVKEVMWNAESNILAVWIERDECDIVQLWTTSNYHWYLKQEIFAKNENERGRFTYVAWHPENALRLLLLTTSQIIEYNFSWFSHVARVQPPLDTGSVAVIDGNELLLTTFRTQNVPPPMASYRLFLRPDIKYTGTLVDSGRTPLDISFSPTGDHLAVLYLSGHVELWNLRTRTEPGRGSPLDPIALYNFSIKEQLEIDGGLYARQVVILNRPSETENFKLAILCSQRSVDTVIVISINDTGVQCSETVTYPGKDGRLISSESMLYWQARYGEIFRVSRAGESINAVSKFSEFCFDAVCAVEEEATLFVGRSNSSKLYCSAECSTSSVLSSNCTSFTVAAGFVIFTATTHEAVFAPLNSIRNSLETEHASIQPGTTDNSDAQKWEKRRVERGSRIVTAVPSTMSLVLQMPRGNLETINPRPMVLEIVKQYIVARNYRNAFLACRKHRVDLSVLVEHDQNAFLENIPLFVRQIDDVDYFNLFLTSLGQSSQDHFDVAKYCDAIRTELEAQNLARYINPILTAYVVKKPADYEAGLSLLLRLRDKYQDAVEEAVKYIVFLVDADILFNTALGMYDFSLVLLIAQHSQRDPREYLHFLRELRTLPTYYQRFKIDDHLRRYSGALNNLNLAGSEYFEEALLYIEKHKLYAEALTLWKDRENDYKSILDIYGDYLFERREFRQAALVFVDGQKPAKALVAYERALLWRELFDLAMIQHVADESINEMAYRVADELLSKKKFDEAAQVILDYGKDVRQCIIFLVQGNLFSEARRLITLHSVYPLVEDILYPAILESKVQIMEELEEMKSQLRKQVERLEELRMKQVQEPDAFYGLDDDPALRDVDVMTDVSMPATAFTRYTVAPSTTSKASKRTSRSKRKMERKIGSGRKGTVDEEEYLLTSVGKLVNRFDSLQGEVAQLLPHLLQFTPEHRKEAKALQYQISEFRKELQHALDEIWLQRTDDGDGLNDSHPVKGMTWAERMEEKRRQRKNVLQRISKPEISSTEASWKAQILDV